MKTSWKWAAAVVVASALVVGCGADISDVAGGNSESANAVTGTEREWKIVADHKTIKAGEVNLHVHKPGLDPARVAGDPH